MASTSSPYGLRAVQKLGSENFNGGGIRVYPLNANSATGFFFGDLVNVAQGVPSICTATPTTTFSASATPTGVFVGCSYDSNGFRFNDSFLPANAYTGGARNIQIAIMEDPLAVFQIQASGSVPATAIGRNAGLTNYGAGSVTTKNSGIQLNASAVGSTSTLAMRIVDIPTTPSGAPGDAYTDCLCVFNAGVHGYFNPATS